MDDRTIHDMKSIVVTMVTGCLFSRLPYLQNTGVKTSLYFGVLTVGAAK
jgi:hypothetical protein